MYEHIILQLFNSKPYIFNIDLTLFLYLTIYPECDHVSLSETPYEL